MAMSADTVATPTIQNQNCLSAIESSRGLLSLRALNPSTRQLNIEFDPHLILDPHGSACKFDGRNPEIGVFEPCGSYLVLAYFSHFDQRRMSLPRSVKTPRTEQEFIAAGSVPVDRKRTSE